MVKRISRDASDVEFWVRFLVGALAEKMNDVVSCRAERVWFSGRTTGCQSVDASSILATRTASLKLRSAQHNGKKLTKSRLKSYFVVVYKHVHTGDKGHGTFSEVHEIVSG